MVPGNTVLRSAQRDYKRIRKFREHQEQRPGEEPSNPMGFGQTDIQTIPGISPVKQVQQVHPVQSREEGKDRCLTSAEGGRATQSRSGSRASRPGSQASRPGSLASGTGSPAKAQAQADSHSGEAGRCPS